MAANLKKSVKLKTDKTTGKAKLERVHAFDASKARKVIKSKKQTIVSPARAKAARGR